MPPIYPAVISLRKVWRRAAE